MKWVTKPVLKCPTVDLELSQHIQRHGRSAGESGVLRAKVDNEKCPTESMGSQVHTHPGCCTMQLVCATGAKEANDNLGDDKHAVHCNLSF